MSSLFHSNSFPLILCPKCFSIPSITIDSSSLTIHCTCSYHSAQSLSTFLTQKIDYTTNTLHHCQFLSSHHSKPAKKFCVQCQQWLCDDCLALHNDIKITKNDSVFQSSPVKSFCLLSAKHTMIRHFTTKHNLLTSFYNPLAYSAHG